jgi:hypothetical protein
MTKVRLETFWLRAYAVSTSICHTEPPFGKKFAMYFDDQAAPTEVSRH